MKHLSLTEDGRRLTLVLPDQLPMRAAAKAVRGYHLEGRSGDLVVFSFPAAPDVVTVLLESFEPMVSPSSAARVAELQSQHAAIEAAALAKSYTKTLQIDPGLRTQPMSQQIAAMNFASAIFKAGGHGAALLMEQGTGKSLAAIGLANWLYKTGQIGWVCAIVPNSLKGTWGAPEGEILTHTDPKLNPQVLITRGPRRSRLEQAEAWAGESLALHWVVVNYETFALDAQRVREHRDQLAGWKRIAENGLLIVDESSMLKNGQAKRTRTITELAACFSHVLILTGTPVTASPLDVYAQFEVVDRGSLGFQSMLAFDRRYAMRQTRRLRSGVRFSEVVGYRDLDDLEQRVARLSYRARAEDCLDLPPVVTKRILAPISPQQRRAISELCTGAMAQLAPGQTIDGRNILTRYLRMSQVLGGFVGVLGPDGRPVEKAEALKPNPKHDALFEYLDLLFDDPSQKAVVFARFKPEIESIRDAARARGWKPVVFYGPTPAEERERGRIRFRDDPETRLFIAQYQTGSKGLTLVSASNIVFYSLTFSLEDFSQARKRVHRIGQTRTVTEAYILGIREGAQGMRPTLDQHILQALQRKQNFADLVSGDAARRILEELA